MWSWSILTLAFLDLGCVLLRDQRSARLWLLSVATHSWDEAVAHFWTASIIWLLPVKSLEITRNVMDLCRVAHKRANLVIIIDINHGPTMKLNCLHKITHKETQLLLLNIRYPLLIIISIPSWTIKRWIAHMIINYYKIHMSILRIWPVLRDLAWISAIFIV